MLESMHLAVTLHPTDIINQDAKRKEAALVIHCGICLYTVAGVVEQCCEVASVSMQCQCHSIQGQPCYEGFDQNRSDYKR